MRRMTTILFPASGYKTACSRPLHRVTYFSTDRDQEKVLRWSDYEKCAPTVADCESYRYTPSDAFNDDDYAYTVRRKSATTTPVVAIHRAALRGSIGTKSWKKNGEKLTAYVSNIGAHTFTLRNANSSSLPSSSSSLPSLRSGSSCFFPSVSRAEER